GALTSHKNTSSTYAVGALLQRSKAPTLVGNRPYVSLVKKTSAAPRRRQEAGADMGEMRRVGDQKKELINEHPHLHRAGLYGGRCRHRSGRQGHGLVATCLPCRDAVPATPGRARDCRLPAQPWRAFDRRYGTRDHEPP